MIKPKKQELASRINKHIKHIESKEDCTPEELSIAWEGYVAALLEWDLISVGDHKKLLALLPKCNSISVRLILLGVDHSQP